MEELVSEAYVCIEDGKYKLEPGRGDVKELVKLENDLVGDSRHRENSSIHK